MQSHTLILTIFRQVWKARNAKLFNGEKLSPTWTSREALVEYRMTSEEIARNSFWKSQKDREDGSDLEETSLKLILIELGRIPPRTLALGML